MNEDRLDYRHVLQEFGLTQEEMDAAAKKVRVVAGEQRGIKIGASQLHGLGITAARPFAQGELIAMSRIGVDWTVVGRYTNHAKNPNARPRWDGEVLWLVAASPIAQSDEITVDYRAMRRALESPVTHGSDVTSLPNT